MNVMNCDVNFCFVYLVDVISFSVAKFPKLGSISEALFVVVTEPSIEIFRRLSDNNIRRTNVVLIGALVNLTGVQFTILTGLINDLALNMGMASTYYWVLP